MDTTTPAAAAVPADLKPAIDDTVKDAHAIAHDTVDGGIALLESLLTNAEGDSETLIPEYEQGSIAAATRALPPALQSWATMVAQFANKPLAALNAKLSEVEKAQVHIAIADLEGIKAHLGG